MPAKSGMLSALLVIVANKRSGPDPCLTPRKHFEGLGMKTGFRVIGVDPGLTRMGYGIVEESRGRLACLRSGTLATSPGPVPARLGQLFSGLQGLIREWSLDAMAVEGVFLKLNLKTGVSAIQASGVAMLAGSMEGLSICEYSPPQVKQSITGVGTASKDQVKFMVKRLLTGEVAPDTADAADALAVAITHINSRTNHDDGQRAAGSGARL